MTPGVAPSPLNPQTPGAGMDSLNFADWFTTDIEVRVKDSHNDAGLGGQVRTHPTVLYELILDLIESERIYVIEELILNTFLNGFYRKELFGVYREECVPYSCRWRIEW